MEPKHVVESNGSGNVERRHCPRNQSDPRGIGSSICEGRVSIVAEPSGGSRVAISGIDPRRAGAARAAGESHRSLELNGTGELAGVGTADAVHKPCRGIEVRHSARPNGTEAPSRTGEPEGPRWPSNTAGPSGSGTLTW